MAEMTATRDPKRLVGRPLEIVSGLSNLSAAEVMSYREMFARKGYTLPDITFPEVTHHIPQKKPRQTRHREPVGTALANRISGLLGIKAGSGCNCKDLAAKMDAWGIAGCSLNHRAEIIAALVGNRDILVSALSTLGGIGHKVAAIGAALAPEWMLREGAEWLLNLALCDVRAGSVCKPKLERVPRPPRQPNTLRNRARASGEHHPSLIGSPINRDRLQSHILYHVMPIAGDTEWVWRKHCNWIREVRAHFNGRLIVGIVTPGPGDQWRYCQADAVREALHGLDAEFILAPNDTSAQKRRGTNRGGKGEGVLFPQMLGRLRTSDPDHVAFYGHCKGVTRPQTSPDAVVHRWADVMFQCLFRNKAEVIDALDTHGVCGSMRMPGGYRDGGPGIGSNWFYSGTFFATRLVDAFGRNWETLPKHYGCVEQWPRLNFDRLTQSACLFLDNVTNLYDESYWRKTVGPAFEQWKREHGASSTG